MTKYWRTLIRVEKVEEDDYVVVIPAINPEKEFLIKKSLIKVELNPNQRFHAIANLSATKTEELKLSNFEF
jgi:hypothetical protein